MITIFDSLYAGHVDMDDIGYGGTAVNSRTFPNEHLVTTFAKARNLARLLDRCGYDTFWLAEHHFQREGYECIPNVLLLALDLAHQTARLKMGCGVNITPVSTSTMAKSSASRRGCHIGVMLNPHPIFSRAVWCARSRASRRTFGMHS